jgi:type I restriction enzyme S subunit
MQQVETANRSVNEIDHRAFKGSGARFQNGDTLLARITPCLENGKTAYVDFLDDEEVGHGSTEFIVLSGIEGVSDDLFVYYLARFTEA